MSTFGVPTRPVAAAGSIQRFCTGCGGQLGNAVQFCTACGAVVPQAAVPQSTAAAPGAAWAASSNPTPVSAPPTAGATAWHYEAGGRQAGPVTKADIARLLSAGTLNEKSLVWSSNLGSWHPISGTILSRYVQPQHVASGASTLHDRIAWFLALAPIIGALLGLIVEGLLGKSGGPIWLPLLAANLIAAYVDEHHLKRAGLYTSEFAPTFVVPWYLFSRSRAMNEQPLYAIVWIIAFVISIVMLISAASAA